VTLDKPFLKAASARNERSLNSDGLKTESIQSDQHDARPVAILDEGKVHDVTSLSRTTRWRMERRGEFPKRVRLSPGRVGWHQADIEAWISSRAA